MCYLCANQRSRWTLLIPVMQITNNWFFKCCPTTSQIRRFSSHCRVITTLRRTIMRWIWHWFMALQYSPMASTDIQHMQLCHPHQVRILSSMKPVNGCTNVLELRKCLQEACKRRPDRPIYFFGEFTCTLSYTCLINEWSRGMQSRGTFFFWKKRAQNLSGCFLPAFAD